MSETPAGWYDDGTGSERYWDGAQWTDHVAPGSASEPVEAQSRSAEKPVPRRSRVGFLLGGALGVVLAALVVGALVLTGLVSVDTSGSVVTSEGGGFDTPEEAAIAYVEALRDQDLTAMREVFAIESYVEACDYSATLEHIGAHQPFGRHCSFPDEAPVGQQANLGARHIEVTEFVVMPLIGHVSDAYFNDGVSVLFEDADAVREFQDETSADFADYPFARVQNIQTAAPGELYDRYDSERSMDYVEMVAQRVGLSGADYVEVAVTFDLDGEEWVFAPSVGRYNDRWYLVSPRGTLGSLLGFALGSGGLGRLEY